MPLQTSPLIEPPAGVNEASIQNLVHTFYDRVRQDPLIGPVFEAQVDDWPEHLEKLCAFWSNVVLRTGRYQGRPMQKHLRLPIEAAHFDRWLQLFRTTASEIMPPGSAAIFIDRANRIADSFELGIGSVRGEIRAPRHAFKMSPPG
ncbi:group III truncated hemoglobin [Kaistia defluvii]|uniref:group III truncated hemoglobin n=1 Tax=Kaistia defluvii TaxID=410841 RepID=UPI0022584FBE|nr:group III truncated hemoglobin [Kaistia defluvii]MCX5520195.1 group III truncated hemoglobin [Kaistia defluvii]